jgi:3',5'-cyclic AMP phosphodiesterase CpdA
MLRALVVSDLHVDIEANGHKPAWRDLDFDIALITGDVRAPGHKAIEWIADAIPDRPAYYVAGNHDFYSHFDKHDLTLKTTYQREIEAMRRRSEQLGVHFLNNDVVILPDGTRVLGTTLWTDFMLRPGYQSFPDAVRINSKAMNDYRCIKLEPKPGHRIKNIEPKHTIALHMRDRKWLQDTLAIDHDDGDTIVMSHHAPHPLSLKHGRPTSETCCAYASDLTPILESGNITHWFHGHIHENKDYFVGNGCRVICNPRGSPLTPRPNSPRENPGFIEDFIIEIGRECVPMPGM